MKSTASAALTSAENTAARAMAPASGGNPCMKIIGRAMFDVAAISGNFDRAMMPRSVGTPANSSRPSALKPTPTRTARSFSAPKIFWSRPGETMNAGAKSAMYLTASGPANVQ